MENSVRRFVRNKANTSVAGFAFFLFVFVTLTYQRSANICRKNVLCPRNLQLVLCVAHASLRFTMCTADTVTKGRAAEALARSIEF